MKINFADQRNRHNENDHTLSGDFHRQDQGETQNKESSRTQQAQLRTQLTGGQ